MSSLKPCPFCGGDKVHLHAPPEDFNANMGKPPRHVKCMNAGCWAEGARKASSAEAITAWNQRAIESAQQAEPVGYTSATWVRSFQDGDMRYLPIWPTPSPVVKLPVYLASQDVECEHEFTHWTDKDCRVCSKCGADEPLPSPQDREREAMEREEAEHSALEHGEVRVGVTEGQEIYAANHRGVMGVGASILEAIQDLQRILSEGREG